MKTGKFIFVGIGGGSGSGKTTFVEKLSDVIGMEQLCLLHHDSYYKDRSLISPGERAVINYDHPSALETDLLAEHLEQLKNGKEIEVPVYDFSTHCRKKITERVSPRPIILVEGILVLHEPALADFFDYKIFIDLDADLLLERRIRRDISERGRTLEDSLRQYTETTRPMLQKFVLPSRINADLVLSGQNFLEGASVSIIGLGLKAILEKRNPQPEIK
jgi:uridine kinase